jgi:hypothetical protein
MRMLDFLQTLFAPSPRRNAVIIAAAALVLLGPALFSGFLIDDHYFRAIFQGLPGIDGVSIHPLDTFAFGEGDPERNHARMQAGLLPWWTPPDWQAAFWRPLSSLSHWIDYRLFGDWAFFMHLGSLLLYMATGVALYALYRRTVPVAWVAALAAWLYIINDSHAVPVAWISNRNTVLATFFSVLVLLWHDRWRRDGWRWGLPLALGGLALGLLSGEATVAVGGYLFAHAVFCDTGSYPRRLARLLPYLAVVLAWRLIYSSLGYGIAKAAIYTDPGSQPLRFAADTLTYFPLLMLAQFAQPDPILVWSFAPPLVAALFWVVAAAVTALVAAAFWPLLRGRRAATQDSPPERGTLDETSAARFWALGMVLATIPACATLPQARLLMVPGIGAMALIAMLLHRWYEGLDRTRLRSAVVYAFVLIHLIVAPLLMLTTTLAIPALEGRFRESNLSLNAIPALESKQLVVLSTLSDLHAVGIPLLRASLGLPVPERTRVLYVGLGPVDVARPDAHTLILTPAGGFLPRPWGQVFVDPRESAYHPGYSVDIDGMRAEILTVLPDGRPERVRFTFETALDDPGLVPVAWRDGAYRVVELAAPGQRVQVPPISVTRLLRRVAAGPF